LIAKGLIEDHGFTQTATAEKLGTTQAAISYYLSFKRGTKYIDRLEKDPIVKMKISEIVHGITAGELSLDDVGDKLCSLCMSLRNQL
jgi:predicted transcriptional regulator